MRIDGLFRSQTAFPAAAPRGRAGVAFSIEDGPQDRPAAAAAPLVETPALDLLLALQAAEDPLDRRRRSLRRGLSMLEALDDIRADLLSGRIDPAQLDRLLASLGDAREHTEPGLDAVIDEIELRVRVELAKLGR